MGEEHRRQTIVATLNTHYAGRATAEAFNVQGNGHPHPTRRAQPLHLRVQVLGGAGGLY
jgi:hypothetical protein